MSGTSRTLRSSNRRAFLRTLLRGTPMARSDVADATGLSTSTVSSIANELQEEARSSRPAPPPGRAPGPFSSSSAGTW